STVKLPLAILALEKLNNMHIKAVNKYTALQIDSSYPKQTAVHNDSTAQNFLPSIAHYIKKAFLVSDNDAYNRLYEFMGQQTINRNLHDKGYKSLRITRQFLGLTAEQNRHTNAIRFINEDGSVIYKQPPAYNTDSFYFGKIIKVGRAHYNSKDSLVNEPIDFTKVNNVPLEDLQQILQSVMFPSSVPAKQRFNLTEEDYTFLRRYLSQYPSETNYPKYDSAEYYDSYVKFYFKNGSHQLPSYIRVFNKVGWAYGFLIDVSYIADFKNNVEFMLTSTVYVNSDGILNDDKYDEEEIGWPFMYELGQTVYRYELERTRKHAPNLRNFKMEYEKRDKKDARPAIKNVDN
ncbi:MAG TPA: serine hydrolase, partial [Panacibacter sp.]|nr:serine hydrolase [Panacibacter sp.]